MRNWITMCVLSVVMVTVVGCEDGGDGSQSVIDTAIANGNAAVVLSEDSKWYEIEKASLSGNGGTSELDGAKEITPGSYTLHVSYRGNDGNTVGISYYYNGSDSLKFKASKGQVVRIALQGGQKPSFLINAPPRLVLVQ